MEVGRGGLNIPTGWPNLFVQMELRFLDVRLCRCFPDTVSLKLRASVATAPIYALLL